MTVKTFSSTDKEQLDYDINSYIVGLADNTTVDIKFSTCTNGHNGYSISYSAMLIIN